MAGSACERVRERERSRWGAALAACNMWCVRACLCVSIYLFKTEKKEGAGRRLGEGSLSVE